MSKRHLQSVAPPSQPPQLETVIDEGDGQRVMEHRSRILKAISDAQEFKTIQYIQAIVFLDLRDLLLLQASLLAESLDLPPEQFPIVMEPRPLPADDPAQAYGGQSPFVQHIPFGPPPSPAFGPPYEPPQPQPPQYPQSQWPPQAAPPPAYGQTGNPLPYLPPPGVVPSPAMLQQIAQYYPPDVMANYLQTAIAPPDAPAAPAAPAAPVAKTKRSRSRAKG